MVGVIIVLLVVAAGLFYSIKAIFGEYGSSRLGRGARMITCPETKEPALVAVATGKMSTSGYRVLDRLRIGECSRWPASENCNQGCIRELEARAAR